MFKENVLVGGSAATSEQRTHARNMHSRAASHPIEACVCVAKGVCGCGLKRVCGVRYPEKPAPKSDLNCDDC
jgi:hypothetical protein